MDVKLTEQDIDILFDAVEKWETGDSSGELMGSMIEAMIIGKDPVAMEKAQAEREKRRAAAELKARQRKERGVMIRAKLIALRDGLDADRLIIESAVNATAPAAE